jgi:hypothetical protein
MKKFILAIGMILICSGALASDKDTIRDACATIKVSVKRSQCFEALDRLSAPLPAAVLPAQAAPAEPVALKISMRGLECLAFEFSEIDSMPKEEVESLYCSYARGAKISETATRKAEESYADQPRVRVAILDKHVSFLGKCIQGMSKTREIFVRKFPKEKIDCSKMPEKNASSSAPTT